MNEHSTLPLLRTSFRILLLATVMGAVLPLAPQSKAMHTFPLMRPELKSLTQYRTEASLYDRSIRAIATITTLKLDTPDRVKQALEILERETPNLRYLSPFLVYSGLNDSTFSTAVKRATDTQPKVEILLKRLLDDPNRILEIEGARSLARRLNDRTSADAKMLRTVAERINIAVAQVDLADPRIGLATVIRISVLELGNLSMSSLIASFHLILTDRPGYSAIEQEFIRAAQQQAQEAIDRLTSCPDKVKEELQLCLSKATTRVKQTRCRTRALESQAECPLSFNFR